MRGVAGFVQDLSASSIWLSCRAASPRPRPRASGRCRVDQRPLQLAAPPLPPSAPSPPAGCRAPSSRHTPFVRAATLDLLLRLVAQAALGRVHDPLEGEVVVGARRRGGNRPSRRGSPSARRSAGRRSRGRAGRWSGTGPRRRASGGEARTRIAMSSRRDRAQPAGAAAASPRSPRRSSAPPPRRPSGRSGGPSRPRLGRSRASCRAAPCSPRSRPRRRRGYAGSSGSSAPAGPPWRRESPSRTAGCCPPRRRASHRSTGRRRPRSRCCGAPAPAAAARGTGRRWCPGTRPRGCSGTSAGTAPARPSCVWKIVSTCSSRSPKSTAFSVRSRSWYCGVELDAAVVEGRRPRRRAPCRASRRGSSSGR